MVRAVAIASLLGIWKSTTCEPPWNMLGESIRTNRLVSLECRWVVQQLYLPHHYLSMLWCWNRCFLTLPSQSKIGSNQDWGHSRPFHRLSCWLNCGRVWESLHRNFGQSITSPMLVVQYS